MKKAIINFLNRKFVRGNINRSERYGALHRAWGYVVSNHMRGDYLEFGIYTGYAFIASYENYQELWRWIKEQLVSSEEWRVVAAEKYADFTPNFHALDTFEGMPTNDEGNDNFRKGNFLSSMDAFYTRCQKAGLKEPQLKIYKGLFADNEAALARQMDDRKAVIINLDCDLYASTKDVFKMVHPFLQVGTVLLIDDYNSFSADQRKGQRKAFEEFRSETNFRFEPWFPYAYVGQAFLCISD